MGRLGTVVVLAVLVPALSLAGCFAGERDPAVTVSQQVDADRDGDFEWLEIRLHQIQGSAPEGADLDPRVVDPAGAVDDRVCRTPELDRFTCEDPLGLQDVWRPGSAVFLPCAGDGENRFEVRFDRGLLFAETHPCGSSPYDGA